MKPRKITGTLCMAMLFCLAGILTRGPVHAAESWSGWVLLNPPEDYQAQLENQKVVLDLMRNGVTVYWYAEGKGSPKPVKRGDYVILDSANHTPYIRTLLKELPGDRQFAVKGLTGWKGYKLRFPRLLLEGNPWAMSWHYVPYYDCLRRGGFSAATLGHHSDAKAFEGVDALIVGGGMGEGPPEHNQILRDYIKNGGGYVGSCNGAAMAMERAKKSENEWDKWFVKQGTGIIEAQGTFTILNFGRFTITKEELPDHPVMWHMPPVFPIEHHNGPVMAPTGANCVTLATVQKLSLDQTMEAGPDHALKDKVVGASIWVAGQRPAA